MAEPLLQVDDLNVSFRGGRGVTRAVRGISFTIGREKVGIVGNPVRANHRPAARSCG